MSNGFYDYIQAQTDSRQLISQLAFGDCSPTEIAASASNALAIIRDFRSANRKRHIRRLAG